MKAYDTIQHRFHKNITGFIQKFHTDGRAIRIYVADGALPSESGKFIWISMSDFRLSYILKCRKLKLNKPSWL